MLRLIQQCGVGMYVSVDKPRSDRQAAGVNDVVRFSSGKIGDRGYLLASDSHIGSKRRSIAGSIDDLSTLDQQIEHV